MTTAGSIAAPPRHEYDRIPYLVAYQNNSAVRDVYGGVAGLELTGQHVEGSQRADAAVGGGVVSAVDVRGAAGESAAPEFVVLQAVQIGVQTLGGTAFSQVNEGFHGSLHRR